MPISQKSNPLTLGERQAVASIFEHSELMSGITKILQQHVNHWENQARAEALSESPSTNRMIQYAARQDEAGQFFEHLKEALAQR